MSDQGLENRFHVFIFFYHVIWTILVLFCAPLAALLKERRFFSRLMPPSPVYPLKDGNIWIHALSVGEVTSALPLVRALRTKHPEKDIVFTATTAQGLAVARKELGGEVKALLTMPLDFWWSVRRSVEVLKPTIFILVETDLWPGLHYYLQRREIKTVLVNGRISPRTFRSYRRHSFLTRMIFYPLEMCLMQSDLDKVRLLKAGVPDGKVMTVGNIKFDGHWRPMGPEEHEAWLDRLGFTPDHLVWVAGSVHQGEDGVLMDVFKRLMPSYPLLRLILAPRRIEEAPEMMRRAEEAGFRAMLKTRLQAPKGHYQIVILDTLGELGRVYGVGKLSFVGGSLVPVGGHNLLEPAFFGLPVLFGPHIHNFVMMSEMLVEGGGGRRVQDGEELFEAVKMLLEDPELSKKMGDLAKGFVQRNRGALDRVISCIEKTADLAVPEPT